MGLNTIENFKKLLCKAMCVGLYMNLRTWEVEAEGLWTRGKPETVSENANNSMIHSNLSWVTQNSAVFLCQGHGLLWMNRGTFNPELYQILDSVLKNNWLEEFMKYRLRKPASAQSFKANSEFGPTGALRIFLEATGKPSIAMSRGFYISFIMSLSKCVYKTKHFHKKYLFSSSLMRIVCSNSKEYTLPVKIWPWAITRGMYTLALILRLCWEIAQVESMHLEWTFPYKTQCG